VQWSRGTWNEDKVVAHRRDGRWTSTIYGGAGRAFRGRSDVEINGFAEKMERESSTQSVLAFLRTGGLDWQRNDAMGTAQIRLIGVRIGA
jgi:hypothetical protein